MGHPRQIRLPFKRQRGATVFALIAAGFLLALGIGVLIDGASHDQIPEVVVGMVFLLLGSAATFALIQTFRSGRGYLELRTNSLVLNDPKLFDEPWDIPIELVRGAAVDSGQKGFRLGGHSRFAIENGSRSTDQPQVARSLYSELGGSPLPIVGPNQPPNVAIVFGAPLQIETLRPRMNPWTASTGAWAGASSPEPGQEYRGVLVAVEEPESVRQFLQEKGLILDDLPAKEAQRLGATAERERKHRRGIWIALVVLVASQVIVRMLFFGGRSDACGALDRVLESRTSRLFEVALQQRKPGSDLANLLVREPPRGFSPAGEGPMSLAQAAQSRRDPEEGLTILRKYEYERGYIRAWKRNDITAGTKVFEFSSEANAREFDVYAARYACVFSNEAFTVRDVSGSIGLQIRYRNGRITDQISFVRGERRYLVWFQYPHVPPSHADATALLRRQAQTAQ